ncbi:MAG: ferredoxin [Rectinemataceae bacterium]|nr:ferredoxin [Spirochaetaceae bacterium]
MADKTLRLKGNEPGSWYVDETCIGCGLCAETAPAVFQLSDDNKAVVMSQPTEPEALAAATQAMSDCPVGAIGNDGE